MSFAPSRRRLNLEHPRHNVWFFASIILCLTVFSPLAVGSTSDLKRGDPVPNLTLTTIDNLRVNTANEPGTVLVMMFAQTGREQTTQACQAIDRMMSDGTLEGASIRWICVLSKGSDPAEFRPITETLTHSPLTVHDTKREVFGNFNVITVPTTIIVDDENKVVHVLPTMTSRFEEIATAAVQLAAHRIELPEFERVLHPQPVVTDKIKKRGELHVRLAKKALGRNLDEMAESEFRKAIQTDPSCTQAHLGLGRLLLRQDRLDDAERAYADLLRVDPESVEGQLGRATVLSSGGSEELEAAEQIVRQILRKQPDHPHAHFVMGLIFEHRGQTDAAMASYKASADLHFHAQDLSPP